MENLNPSNSSCITPRKTKSVMLDLLIALAPATVAAIVFFGLRAAVIIAVCVGTSLLSEFVFNILAKKEQTVGDLSAVVTGLLLALNLSTNVTIWQCIVGSVFAIVIVKCAFGGLGFNVVNPAIAARVMLLIAFTDVAGGAMTGFAEIESGATPLAILGGSEGTLPSILDMLIGNRGGAIGETCIIALCLGGIYLIIRKVITWEIPVVYIGGVFLLSLAFGGDVMNAVYHVLGGGLVLGAIFMATDPVTSPKKCLGKIVFALGCALITVLIRFYGNYPEGVSFAILLMNILCPYVDFIGAKKEKNVEAAE
ncbi:MAG: RnfABCDGE type electron transport complex subunit D [Clostridia bacterium]|nr:RnfABCDGE type electron transport complex subunit D [Clostridia bacterium]